MKALAAPVDIAEADGAVDLLACMHAQFGCGEPSSSAPGSDRANMPLRFVLSSASGGKSGNSGLNTPAMPTPARA